MIDGCDIAELLLKDRKDFQQPYATNSQISTFARNSDSENKESSSNIDADNLSEYSMDAGRNDSADAKLTTKIKEDR